MCLSSLSTNVPVVTSAIVGILIVPSFVMRLPHLGSVVMVIGYRQICALEAESRKNSQWYRSVR